MSNIGQVLARVFVPDLDTAVPLYEELAQARAQRFGFRDVELASASPNPLDAPVMNQTLFVSAAVIIAPSARGRP